MNTKQKYKQLKAQCDEAIAAAKQLLGKDDQELNWKASASSWSAFECIQHLNLYAAYYLPALEQAINKARSNPQENIKLHFMGRKSIEAVSLDTYKAQKTLKRMNPLSSQLSKDCVKAFLMHQEQLCKLIEQSAAMDINQKLVPIEFLKFFKLSIAETLIFTIEHQRRHLLQAEKACSNAVQTV